MKFGGYPWRAKETELGGLTTKIDSEELGQWGWWVAWVWGMKMHYPPLLL